MKWVILAFEVILILKSKKEHANPISGTHHGEIIIPTYALKIIFRLLFDSLYEVGLLFRIGTIRDDSFHIVTEIINCDRNTVIRVPILPFHFLILYDFSPDLHSSRFDSIRPDPELSLRTNGELRLGIYLLLKGCLAMRL